MSKKMRLSEYDLDNKLWHYMDIEEEKEFYAEVLQRVINNPRYYLDNLDTLLVFRVSFLYYPPEKIETLIN